MRKIRTSYIFLYFFGLFTAHGSAHNERHKKVITQELREVQLDCIDKYSCMCTIVQAKYAFKLPPRYPVKQNAYSTKAD